MGYDQGVRIVHPAVQVHLGGVEVVQVRRPYPLLRDPGRQGDRHPAPLPRHRVVRAGAAQVRRVREDTPVQVPEPGPLFDEVVPAVVPDLVDLRVHRADRPDVRGVQDDLAAVRDHRLDLVEAFGGGPHIGVPRGHDRQDAADRGVQVPHVDLRRHVGGRRPGRLRGAEAGRVQDVAAGTHHDAQGQLVPGYEGGGLVDERAYRGDPAGTDDLGTGDQGAQPVRQVDDLLTGDAREEVPVAAGEPDHLVREHRTDAEGHVVLHDGPVEPDVHGVVQQPPGQLADPAGADRTDGREARRVPPLVVEYGRVRVRAAEVPGQLRLGHRRVGTQGDQYGQPAHPAVQRLVDGRQQQGQRAATGTVR